MPNVLTKCMLMSCLLGWSSLTVAQHTAHGLTDGMGLNPKLIALVKDMARQIPFSLTDKQLYDLATHPTWQQLLIKPKNMTDDEFFLAQGDPKGELIAMLGVIERQDGQINRQFVARMLFLHQQLQHMGVAIGR